MIRLTPHRDGICLPVRARGGARRNEIRGEHDGALKVSVTPVPEKGKANRAIHALLCQRLDLRRSQLELVSGHTSSQKLFIVREVSADTLHERIERALADCRP